MKKQFFILILALVFPSLSPGFAMDAEEDRSVMDARLKKLKQFQQKTFFEPSEKWKKNQRIQKQELHAQYRGQNAGEFYAVENIQEVDNILKQSSFLYPEIHRIGFIDLDETLLFGGGLGWVYCCVHKLAKEHWKQFSLALSKYGFQSFEEFLKWGKANFPIPEVQTGGLFYRQKSVIEPNVPGVLESWHKSGMNLFGLTSRDHTEDTMLTYTRESLIKSGVYFHKLSHIVLDNDKINFIHGQQQLDSGIIYSPTYGKFEHNGAGIRFFEAYLKELSKEQPCPQAIEILIVDDSDLTFLEFSSCSNIEAIQKLEEKFKTKISFKYFQPFSNWRSPYEHWDKIKYDRDDFDQNKTALEALHEFLQMFATPPEQPFSGPFYKHIT